MSLDLVNAPVQCVYTITITERPEKGAYEIETSLIRGEQEEMLQMLSDLMEDAPGPQCR